MNPFSVAGKLALVTGGSRGIGLGAARALCESDAHVILVARRSDNLSRARLDIQGSNSSVETCAFDLTRTSEIAAWFEDCVARYGRPDILVNAAGMTRRASATETTLHDWDAVFSLNVTAVFELSRVFAAGLIKENRPGKVINIASLMTAAARPGTSAYTASKGAVGQLTKALAMDWAKHKIHVNAIAPGYIRTDLTNNLSADAGFSAWVEQRCPLGRWGTPDDVAWPIVFLASPASDFMTGQVIYVDGGWLSTF